MEESSHATPVMVKKVFDLYPHNWEDAVMETQRGTVMDECSHEVLLLPPLLPGNLGMHATASSELAS
ncbi:hypothetical protein C4D60_Mb03t04370 [Musa balbisiana]|uniref:Uncharacterized protein n=1 Tax=Musa balbisiana TaxID=52838 RepID=A0A4S8J7G5_MUSBA|nr:hypothetical protein C4D60_Mb03t04370 [Musa balbisiana]